MNKELYIKDDKGNYVFTGSITPHQLRMLALDTLKTELRGETMSDPEAATEYIQHKLSNKEHEVFACMFLDNRHRLICFKELFRGTIDGAAVYPREVVKEGLKQNAAAVILAHNHPSGVTEPSMADRDITERLLQALGLVGIRVLDHIVVGSGEMTSFAQRGLI